MNPDSATAVAGRAGDVRVRALYGVFVVSGVCGLIYESIWSHYLKLFVGHAAYAQTVVLIVFIGGMALGAAVVGRHAQRIRVPLVGYAIAEGVIGLVSLVFHRLFVVSTDWAYASLLPAACVPESPCVVQWLFAAALILPQSILLGTTFPLMTSGILRLAPRAPGRSIALLYFLNSIGAAAGVLLAGFVLIPALGLPGTLLTAGLMNIAVALAAWACAKGSPPVPLAVAGREDAAGGTAAFRRWLVVVAALTGLSSFVYEIAWIRMLALVVGTSTHAFELMLAAFIFGLAMGGLWVRKRIDRFPDLIHALAAVQVLMGVAAVATLALYDGMFDVMGWLFGVLKRGEAAYGVYNLANHLFALAIMLPATFLAGMTFPLITTALLRGADGERAIGYTYAANTLGSIVGVILAVHLALPLLGVKGTLVFGAAIDVALGIALLAVWRGSAGLRPALQWGGAGVLAVAAIALAAPVLPERMASGVYRHGKAKIEAEGEIAFHRDGKTASVTVVRTPTVTTIRTNGKPDAGIAPAARGASADEVTMTFTAVLPLALHPAARTAAVIGFGSGMTTATLLGSPNIVRVDTLEIEPQMVEGARLFGKVVEPAFADPRSRIVIDDAKSYFARSRERYDLIVSEPSNPWVSGVASLFTQEFYARAKRQLEPGGLFVQWIQVYEFNDALLATILRALDAEFRDFAVYAANDGDLVIVASTGALPPAVRDDFTRWPALRPLLERTRLAGVGDVEARRVAGKPAIGPLLAVFGDGVNSDYYPLVDQAAPKARFVGEMAGGLMRAATAPVPVLELVESPRRQPAVVASDPIAPPLTVTVHSAARHAAAFMRTGAGADDGAPLPRDIGLARAVLNDCASVPPRVRMAGVLHDLAVVVNAGLERTHAQAFWASVAAMPCVARLGAQDRQWLSLFAAVASRDTATMAALAPRLVDDAGANEDLRVYAVMAGAAGLIAAGRHADAERFLAASVSGLPARVQKDPPLRLLLLLARSGGARQLAAR